MTASAEPQTAAGAPAQMRVPDFFIAGHHKCGTTALYEMLRAHPQIYMPDVKEPWYFADDLRVRFQASDPLPSTLQEYLSLFTDAAAEQRVGEATPSYLLSHNAAANIAAVQPQARIIAILREPASFLRSLHLQSLKNHAETETDLRKALALEGARREGRMIPRDAIRPQDLYYSEHVHYVEQLRRYHAQFAASQVLVLIYDDFRDDNEAAVRKVLRFLEVDERAPLHASEANPTVRVRSQRAYELVRSLYLGRGPVAQTARAAIKALTPARLRRDAYVTVQRRLLYGSPRPPDQELMQEIRSRYKSEVVALSEYLDRDLVTLWGYERIA